MRGQLFLPIILISIIISFMPLNHATCQLYAAPNTITVPDDYSSIQAAINAANAGDIVYVRNGTYYELVEVNKTISLVGENKDATVIDGNGIPNISVLSIYDVSNATIQDLTVQNGTAGLFLGNANYTKLRNISLRSNQQNIILFDPLSLQNTTEDIDESNTVDGKPVYFWINRENGQIPSDAGYVALINCNNVTVQEPALTKDGIVLINVKDCLIENATITETQTPLQTIGANNCTIRNSLFNNSTSGVGLWNFNQSSFTNNIITNVTQGDAVILGGSFSTISENTILNNNRGYGGLHVMGDHNMIIANKILNNSFGIKIDHSYNNNVSSNQIEMNFFSQLELFNSSFNSISGNRIVGNMSGSSIQYEMGINLNYYSDNNTIVENLIEGNYYGIEIMQANNNSFFHNNIVNNEIEAYTVQASNVWDNGYPSGGNHWGDYTGIDKNHDGIGDTPYEVPNDNMDNYPLMNPYTVPEFQFVIYLLLFAFLTFALTAIKKRKKKA